MRAVIGLVPPRGRANFNLSPSLKRRSVSLYLAASEAVEEEGFVEWTRVTSKPMRSNGVFHWPESREWSSRIDRSNGCNLGNDGTIKSCAYVDVKSILVDSGGRNKKQRRSSPHPQLPPSW